MNTAKKLSVNRENNLRLVTNGGRATASTLDRQRRWSLVGMSAFFAALFSFTATGFMDLGSFYSGTVYFSLWCTLAVGYSAFQELYGDQVKQSFRSSYSVPTLLGIAFTAFIFYSVGTESRLPVEESYWTAVSQTLHQTSGLGNGRGPSLFPFFASLFHSLFGYQEQHLFWVNFVACTLLLSAVIRFGEKQLKSRAFGLIAVTLLASFPLFGILVTSNNPELLNAFFVTAVAYQLYRFLQNPTLNRWELAAVLTILAAQCRSSSFFFVVPLLAAAYQNRKKLLAEKAGWRAIALPVLCIPVLCVVSANHFLLNGFSPSLLMENFGEAVGFLLNPKNTFLLSSQLFSLAALAGMALLASQWQRLTKQEPIGIKSAGFILLGLASVTIGQYAFDNGNVLNFATSRLIMVYLPLLALAATYPIYRLYQRPTAAPVIALLVIANLCYQMPTHSRTAVHQSAGARVIEAPVIRGIASKATATKVRTGKVTRTAQVAN